MLGVNWSRFATWESYQARCEQYVIFVALAKVMAPPSTTTASHKAGNLFLFSRWQSRKDQQVRWYSTGITGVDPGSGVYIYGFHHNGSTGSNGGEVVLVVDLLVSVSLLVVSLVSSNNATLKQSSISIHIHANMDKVIEIPQPQTSVSLLKTICLDGWVSYFDIYTFMILYVHVARIHAAVYMQVHV